MTPPSSRRVLPIGPRSARDPESTPPVTSLWPFKYFVALCIERSTPMASGCWLTGLAKVLSMPESTPAARHAAAIDRMSTQRSVGLIGDSNHTIFVWGPITVAGDANCSSETNRRAMPRPDSRCSMR
jgi:hypothetical protein